jgi:hypothetical protein
VEKLMDNERPKYAQLLVSTAGVDDVNDVVVSVWFIFALMASIKD